MSLTPLYQGKPRRASGAGEGQHSKISEMRSLTDFQFSRSHARVQPSNSTPEETNELIDTTPRKFKIEGSSQMLEALAQAIQLALRAARTTPDRTGARSVSRGPLTIEVESMNHDPNDLKYVIASIEDAVSTVTGWAETKRCIECEQPVAYFSTTHTSKLKMAKE